MDSELIAVMVAIGLALVPVGVVFRARWLRFGLLLCWFVAWLAVSPGLSFYRSAHAVVERNDRPVERVRDDYVTSEECGACHPREYDTWKHTWHRTMTQVASPDAIFGDFDEVDLETQGWKTRLERRGDQFFARVYEPGINEYMWREIVLTTGSHHMQAYWYARGPDKPLGQLQFMYLKEDRKWVPRVAAFLMPPSLTATVETGRWNTVCLGCHTTRGRPGMAHEHSPEAQTDTVEFGISCEACHGPGGEHVRANRGNPVRRYAKHFSDAGDATIVNAERLTKARSAEVCGQCHGIGSAPKDVPAFYRRGYDYRAGEVLDETGRSIVRGGPLFPLPPTEVTTAYHDSLFWQDGMVRVSGREVNGLYETPCFESGEMTCLSCHTMHKASADERPYAEWADDMLLPGMRTNQACTQCHSTFSKDVPAHTHHAADSTGSECMNCHMPYTTWGLLKGIRQHTVDSPTVRASVENGRPNACNACHIDETLQFTAERLAAWYGQPIPALNHDQKTVAASLSWLLEGDAGQRALAAWYLGWAPAQAVGGKDWIAPHLAPLLEDPYDVVRYVAAQSLRGLEGFEGFEYDFVGAEPDRAPAKHEVWRRYALDAATGGGSGQRIDDARAARLLLYADGSLDRVALGRLLARRNDQDVSLAE